MAQQPGAWPLELFDELLLPQHGSQADMFTPGGAGLLPAAAGGAAICGTQHFSAGDLSTGGSGGGSGELGKEDGKLDRARARNREKQARFRARQKEAKQHLAERHEAAAADLERERQLNASMRLQGSLLEGVRQSKEQAIGLLEAGREGQQQLQQQQQQQAQPPQLQQAHSTVCHSPLVDAAALGSSSALAANGCAAGGSGPGGGGQLAAHILGLPFRQRVELLCRIFNGTQPARQLLKQHASPSYDGFALDLHTRREVGQIMVAEQPQVLEAALALTPQQVIEEWGAFAELCAEVIQQVDRGELGEAEAEERLQPAVIYESIQHAILLHHKPECVRQLLEYCRLPGESETEAAARWRQVAVETRCTEEQVAALLPLYNEYLERMRQLSAESAASLATLRKIQQELSQQLLQMEDSLSAAAAQYLELFQAAGQLSSQPDMALFVQLSFYGRSGGVVSPLQKARMTAACRPLHPDVVSIVREGLRHYGLIPEDVEGVVSQAAVARPAVAGAPPAAGAPQ